MVELPVPHNPFGCSTSPAVHTFVTTVVFEEFVQFEESPGIGKYPVGHEGDDIYLEPRFVFSVNAFWDTNKTPGWSLFSEDYN
jgi:hypothetical protein